MSSRYLANTKRLKGKTYEEIYGVEKAKMIKKKMSGRIPWNKGKSDLYKGEKNTFYGKHHTEETKTKISKALRGYKHGKEFCLKNSLVHKGIPKTAEHKAKTISQWGNKEWANRQIMLQRLGMQIKPNKPERAVLDILNEHYPNEWKYVGDGSLVIERLNPDFVNIDGKKEIIEVFGEYFHGRMKGRRETLYSATEEGRKEIFARYGYRTLVIWQSELKDMEQVIKKIADFVEENRA